MARAAASTTLLALASSASEAPRSSSMPQPSSELASVSTMGTSLAGGDRGAEVDALVGGHGDVLRAVGIRGFEDVAASYHV